jgi:hypothetical protein
MRGMDTDDVTNEQATDEAPGSDEPEGHEDYDISLVLGELHDEPRAQIQEQLDGIDRRLEELAETLSERSGRESWHTDGVRVEVFESGQSMIKAGVSDPDEGMEFGVELRPSNFFEEGSPWRPGQPPRPMNTTAWDVEGEAQVRRVAKVSGRKYTIQETVAELEEQRFDSAEEAVAAFARYIDDMAELAVSRDPVVAAWQSDVDEYGADPNEEPPHEFL